MYKKFRVVWKYQKFYGEFASHHPWKWISSVEPGESLILMCMLATSKEDAHLQLCRLVADFVEVSEIKEMSENYNPMHDGIRRQSWMYWPEWVEEFEPPVRNRTNPLNENMDRS